MSAISNLWLQTAMQKSDSMTSLALILFVASLMLLFVALYFWSEK